MKKSINAWSVDGGIGFLEMFRKVKSAGFDAIELNLDREGFSAHSLNFGMCEKELLEIKKYADEYSLPVISISSSLYCGLMGSDRQSDREKEKDILRKQLECARILGADGILCVPGGIDDTVSIRKAYDNASRTLHEMKEEIESSKINVCLENVWNGFFTSPYEMVHFIDSLGSGSIRAYFDVGNVMAFSWPEHWIEILGNRIDKVHVKDFKRNGGINCGGEWMDLLEGDVNWKPVVTNLKAAGFDQYLTAEVFPLKKKDNYDFLIDVSERLDRIIADRGE